MHKTDNFQNIPRSGDGRIELRKKGQFWTPAWIAEAMVAFVVDDESSELFDPAVGAGAFFRAALDIQKSNSLRLLGCEIDTTAFDDGIKYLGLTEDDFKNVELRDFVLNPPQRKFDAIVANPPYIRHHLLSKETKIKLRKVAKRSLGVSIDGRAGLHIYFLIIALTLLNEGGKLAFIMPADTSEGVFSSNLWNWISSNFRIDAVITFTHEASPFPEVDVNPIIYLISKNEPTNKFIWAKCHKKTDDELKRFILSGYKEKGNSIDVIHRDLSEGLKTGLSRPPLENNFEYTLSDFATVIRGIATGNNNFFLFTPRKAEELGIPPKYVKFFIGKTRYGFTAKTTGQK